MSAAPVFSAASIAGCIFTVLVSIALPVAALAVLKRKTGRGLLAALVGAGCFIGYALVLEQLPLLDELGYGVEEFGEGTVLLRQAPMDLSPEQAADCLTSLVQDLQEGKREDRDGLRDHILHTMACKAAIKAGWHTDSLEREALVREVLGREDLKYCPHGRPVCIRLTKQQLERQFGRA